MNYAQLAFITFVSFLWSRPETYAADLFKTFEKVSKEVSVAGESPLNCDPKVEDQKCPPVHVTPWCKKQYELLLNTRAKETSPIQKVANKKSILFLGEEHGDEQAYSYYEKLLKDKTAGFDCLFLELPSVFQDNFDNKNGIVQKSGIFEKLSKVSNSNEFSRIEIKDYSYIALLESLVKVAKEQKVKVILVDSSEKVVGGNISETAQVGRRNRAMAKNILAAYSRKECSSGLSIQGGMHLFTKNQAKDLTPIDTIIKKDSESLAEGEKIEVKKAFIYSPTSQSFLDAMGPCSWLNVLPQETESYFSGQEFYSDHEMFPERISSSIKEAHGGIDKEVDYVVVLPSQLDKSYLLKKLNENRNDIPKKFKFHEVVSVDSSDVSMELRSNSSSLGVTFGEASLANICLKKCSDRGYRSELRIKDIIYRQPKVNCQSFHPSRTNGANYAPIFQQDASVVGDCYCTTKY
jgi:hypothetical protein